MASIRKTDDPDFRKVKQKIVKAIDKLKDDDIDNLVSLANVLVKIKAVELKDEDGDFGSGLGGDDDAG